MSSASSSSEKDGGRGAFKDIGWLKRLTWYIATAHTVIATLYFTYYPWTRKFVFTYLASPSTYGILTSERWVSLQWWTCILTALCIPPILWLGIMNDAWLTRWLKWWWLYVIVPLELVLWLLTWAVEFFWLATRNDPRYPTNPATSNRACCTPEWYNTVGACRNYGDLHPECNPGIDFGELGTNPDFVFFFVVTFAMLVVFILYFVVSWHYMKRCDDLVKYGDPECPIPLYQVPLGPQPTSLSSGGGGGGDYTQVPTSSTDSLNSRVTAWGVLKSRK
jgi:hypothetical protein